MPRRFKLLERLEPVDAFPMSPAGKMLRRALRTMAAAKLAAEKEEPPRAVLI